MIFFALSTDWAYWEIFEMIIVVIIIYMYIY